MRKIVKYSEAFKLQVLQELEDGRFNSAHEARTWYGIGGKGTVLRWVRKYGKDHLTRKVVRVETQSEKNELKRLKEENAQLKEALAAQSVKRLIEESYFELLCEANRLDPNEFKKNTRGMRCSGKEKRRELGSDQTLQRSENFAAGLLQKAAKASESGNRSHSIDE